MVDQIFSVFLGDVPRDDAIPYVADFFLQLENVRWTLVSGVVNGSFVMSVRNLGYSKNAGDFVRRFFVDIGSAGGHRAMAKAVVPIEAFQARFGPVRDDLGEKMTAATDGIPARGAGRTRRRRNPFTRRAYSPPANHRLDKLFVRIFVSSIHELAKLQKSIRPLVVNAAKNRTGRSDCEQAGSRRRP